MWALLLAFVVGANSAALFASPGGATIGTCQSSSAPCSLRRALEASAPFDVITLGPGVFVEPSLVVKKLNTTLLGAGATLTFVQADPLTVWGNASLFVSDVGLDDQVSPTGAIAVNSGAYVSIQRCVFRRMSRSAVRLLATDTLQSTLVVDNCVFADGFHTAATTSDFGGGLGIRSDHSATIQVSQSTFLRNTCFLVNPSAAFHRGCAVYVSPGPSASADVTIVSSLFDSNWALYTGPNVDPEGAALYVSAEIGALSVTGSQFVNNSAQSKGGAVYADIASLRIDNSLFRDNSSPGYSNQGGGGALFIQNGTASAMLSFVTFRRNIVLQSGAVGGAVGLALRNATQSIVFQNCSFFDNMGNRSGAVGVSFSATPSLSITFAGSYFCGNLNQFGTLSDFSCSNGGNPTVLVTNVASPSFSCSGAAVCDVTIGGVLRTCQPAYTLQNAACSKPITAAEQLFPGPVTTVTTPLNITGVVSVTGNLQITGGSVTISSGGSLVVSGQVTIAPGTNATLTGVTTGNVVLIQAGSVSGEFASLTAVSGSPCITATATPSYSSSTVSALVTTTNVCPNVVDGGSGGGSGLSGGAIAGIAIGAIVGGILLVVVIYIFTRRLMRKRQQKMIAHLRASNIAAVQGELNAVEGQRQQMELQLTDLEGEVARVSTTHMQQLIEEKKMAGKLTPNAPVL